MANLKSDSSLSRRIVRAFFDFLDSVEPAPGVDPEGLEVARECLAWVFNLDYPPVDDHIEPGFLINVFRSLEANGNKRVESDRSSGSTLMDAPSSHNAPNGVSNEDHSDSFKTQEDDWTRVSSEAEVSKDELLGQFVAALEKIRFLSAKPDGSEDPVQLERAAQLFHKAINEMEKTGCQSYTRDSLAETLKSLGNRAMQSKLYADAIEPYSCAISLSENNAVYYCNRAAAYTQIHKCDEAIRDCLKSIEIDPNYSKAYSRLGLAYYAQGKYRDAIEKGFKKALHLDPSNEPVKENIRVAEQKLKDERQWPGGDQPTSSSGHGNQESNNQAAGGPRSQGIPPPFGMPLNIDVNSIPVNLSAMWNMANTHMGVPQDGEPQVRVDGNFDLNFAEGMPAELGGALRSMMSMFSGAAPPHDNPQDTTNGRSSTN